LHIFVSGHGRKKPSVSEFKLVFNAVHFPIIVPLSQHRRYTRHKL
jgi:hypothetical protein